MNHLKFAIIILSIVIKTIKIHTNQFNDKKLVFLYVERLKFFEFFCYLNKLII